MLEVMMLWESDGAEAGWELLDAGGPGSRGLSEELLGVSWDVKGRRQLWMHSPGRRLPPVSLLEKSKGSMCFGKGGQGREFPVL